MIKIGITGQSGFIGYHLYYTLSLNTSKYKIITFADEFFYDIPKLNRFVSACDVVIHLAALNRHTDPKEIFIKNMELVDKLIEALKLVTSQKHIIFSSSIQEDKDNPYGKSKLVGREKLADYCKNNGHIFSGLIVPNVFGPFGRPFYNSVISTFSHQLANGVTPRLEADTELKLIYIGELVRDIIKIVENKVVGKISIPHSTVIKVSELLFNLSEFSRKYLNTGEIPPLLCKFDIDLFNTFRSYIPFEQYFPFFSKKNEDERGVFVELMRIGIGGQISFSSTKNGITRGNHFHTRKIERFFVISGRAEIEMRKIGTNKILKFNLDGNSPAYVDIPIWYTHNITNIGELELLTIFWINEPYDKIDPDTYFEKVTTS